MRDALSTWAAVQMRDRPELTRIGLFGSYARGDYAPGSDLDLLLIVKRSDEARWFMRAIEFDTRDLPVGADLFVYTEDEAARMKENNPWFRHVLREILWIDAGSIPVPRP